MSPRKRKFKQESLPAKQKLSTEPTRRWSTRGQTANTASTWKSPYFEHPSGDEDKDGFETKERPGHGSEAGFESEHETATPLPKKRGNTVEKGDANPEKRRKNLTNPGPSSRAKKSKRSGEIFIPIRQPSPGDTEYQGHMIHANTLDFLRGLFCSFES